MTTNGIFETRGHNFTVFLSKTHFIFIHSVYHPKRGLCASEYCPKKGISKITQPSMKRHLPVFLSLQALSFPY